MTGTCRRCRTGTCAGMFVDMMDEMTERATRGGPAHATMVAFTLLVALVGSLVLAHAMLSDPPTGARFVEPAVPPGEWAFSWDPGMQPPSVEQARQVGALRRVAGGTGGLVALLSLLIAAGLWHQRARLSRAEHFVHWAVGARRRQLAARLALESRRQAAVGLLLAITVSALVGWLLGATFPGPSRVAPSVVVGLLVCVGLAVVLLRSEGRAGERAARVPERPIVRLLSGPGAIATLGFAVLTGVGLLTVHAPTREADGADGVLVAGVALGGSERAGDTGHASLREARTWLSAVTARAGLGLASTGAARGVGVSTLVWIDCGRCFEGGLPLPLRTARADVHAVAPDTFPHLGLALLEGRDFDDLDAGAPSVAIVSRSLARRHFDMGRAVGRQLRVGDTAWLAVVGIVDDRIAEAGPAGAYVVYLPVAQAAPTNLEALGSGHPAALRAALADAPSSVHVSTPRSRDELFAAHGWFARVLSVLGLAACVLVGIGVWVGARAESEALAREIAIRRAVGARRRHLLASFASSSARRLVGAMCLGGWLSLFMGAGLARAYGGVPQVDLGVWIAAAVPVGAALLLGSWGPFARALARPPASGL